MEEGVRERDRGGDKIRDRQRWREGRVRVRLSQCATYDLNKLPSVN